MPFLEAGGFDELRWGDDQFAFACASHGGEPEHVALAQAMLADVGLEEGDLACGPHDPISPRGLKLLRESGARVSRLHNNCSGKHAAMLARAHTAGWPTYGYERRDHPVQRCCLQASAKWTGLEESDIGQAVDGCGVVAFSLALDSMARAWSRLGRASRDARSVASRIVHAMATRPFLVGGTDRFDSVLIEETDGRVVAKIGAEGVHCAAVPELGIGIAVKVDDGASRAQFPAVLRAAPAFRRACRNSFRRGSKNSCAARFATRAAKQSARFGSSPERRAREFGSTRRRLMTPPADIRDSLDVLDDATVALVRSGRRRRRGRRGCAAR